MREGRVREKKRERGQRKAKGRESVRANRENGTREKWKERQRKVTGGGGSGSLGVEEIHVHV